VRTAISRIPVSSFFHAVLDTANRETRMAAEKRSGTRRLRIFNRALWQQASNYRLSGLVIMGIGTILICSGLLLNMGGAYSPLVVGLGVMVILVGIIRVLIGFIQPTHSEDLSSAEEPKSSQQELHEAIFDKEVLTQEDN
jgi:hypothetical protein